jgi:hypothetical protein
MPEERPRTHADTLQRGVDRRPGGEATVHPLREGQVLGGAQVVVQAGRMTQHTYELANGVGLVDEVAAEHTP